MNIFKPDSRANIKYMAMKRARYIVLRRVQRRNTRENENMEWKRKHTRQADRKTQNTWIRNILCDLHTTRSDLVSNEIVHVCVCVLFFCMPFCFTLCSHQQSFYPPIALETIQHIQTIPSHIKILFIDYVCVCVGVSFYTYFSFKIPRFF